MRLFERPWLASPPWREDPALADHDNAGRPIDEDGVLIEDLIAERVDDAVLEEIRADFQAGDCDVEDLPF
jgi:hypothetical protein